MEFSPVKYPGCKYLDFFAIIVSPDAHEQSLPCDQSGFVGGMLLDMIVCHSCSQKAQELGLKIHEIDLHERNLSYPLLDMPAR